MTIVVPGDKSISHRALLLGALSHGITRLRNVLPGGDCARTAAALRALGAPVPSLPPDGSPFELRGVGARGLRSPREVIDCGNSGTTTRLLLGILAGAGLDATLDGDASLRSRPMARVTDPLSAMGGRFEELAQPGRLPLRVFPGRLRSFEYRSPVASAQVKSALLLAGLLARVPIRVTEPERSRDHTERLLRRMGVEVTEGASRDGGWRVEIAPAAQPLRPFRLTVPSDPSSAAFILGWALLGGAHGELRIPNVGLNPTRTGFLSVLDQMGARIRVEGKREEDDPAGEPAGDLVVAPSPLRGVTIQGGLIPSLIDEIPLLAVLAARAEGVTVIRDAAELRVKESDRIRALVENLAGLGVEVEEFDDGLSIRGSERPLEGRVTARMDHRIAMAFGVLGALPGNRIEVDDPGIVEVSFPGFWNLLAGGER